MPGLAALSGACSSKADLWPAAATVGYVRVNQGPKLAGGTGTRSLPPIAAAGLRPTAGQECDVCINGVSNCGGPCGGAGPAACGSPGECDCTLGGYALIGFCGSHPPSAACTFCPPGTKLSDPCGTECEILDGYASKVPPPNVNMCPSDYPVACGGDACCPNHHSKCCGFTTTQYSKYPSVCGVTQSDCDDATDRAPTSGNSGSTGGSCQQQCPNGFSKAGLRPGCCTPSAECTASCADGCGNGWVEAKGKLFGPCSFTSASASACAQAAAQAALNSCK